MRRGWDYAALSCIAITIVIFHFLVFRTRIEITSAPKDSLLIFRHKVTLETADIFIIYKDTTMIRKAKDDFKARTLAALPTLLEKLAYICSLQTSEGAYEHWGLTRVFGEGESQAAIGTAHAETAAELTRLSVREIYKEFLDATDKPISATSIKPENFVLKAPVTDDGLLSAHLRLIQESVVSLAREERSNRPTA